MSSVKAVISKFKRTQIWLTGGCSAFFEADFSVDFFSTIAGKMGKYEKEGKKYGSISLLMQSTCGSHQSHDVSSGSSPIFAGRVTRDQINPEKGCGFENYQEAKDLTLATSKALQCFSIIFQSKTTIMVKYISLQSVTKLRVVPSSNANPYWAFAIAT